MCLAAPPWESAANPPKGHRPNRSFMEAAVCDGETGSKRRQAHATRGALPRASSFLALFLALFILPGCVDESIVFQERQLFEQPPDQTFNFLGYFDEAEKLTTCGNCHVGQQAGWENTAHAHAWETLQASPGAQALCEPCHSVNENGNALDEPAGYNLVQDDRYHDVQCESCHGSGFEHVQNPDATQPLASALVGADLTNGCGDCHSGAHHPFVDEWEQSPHAQLVDFAAANDECAPCHRGQGVLVAWGENSNYLEKDSDEYFPQTCIVCHDPHDATNEHQLRFPVETASIEEHLCARCHNRRTAPDPSSTHGLEPHSPESALLVGDAGWFPPGAQIDQGEIRGTHGSERNPALCATCHVSSFEVTDPDTGDHVFSATGHLFRPIPCLDAQGIPLPFVNDCEISTTARTFAACTEAGCHGDATAAFSALSTRVADIQDEADKLLAQLEKVDPLLEEVGGEIDPEDPTFTVAEGAFFNYHLATFGNETFGTNTVVGSSVHNPFLVKALLVASQQAVFDKYGFAPAPGVTSAQLTAKLQAVINSVPK